MKTLAFVEIPKKKYLAESQGTKFLPEGISFDDCCWAYLTMQPRDAKPEMNERASIALLNDEKWDRVIVSSAMPELWGDFSKNFFGYLSSLLKKSGSIFLAKRNTFGKKELLSFFGEQTVIQEEESFWEIKHQKKRNQKPSIVDFFYSNHISLIAERLQISDKIINDVIRNYGERENKHDKPVLNAFADQSYYFFGIWNKSIILNKIIDRFLGHENLMHLDVGGGYGLLAAELSFSRPEISSSQVIDHSSDNLRMFQILKKYCSKRIDLSFSLSSIEKFKFPEKTYDIITFLGSLVYVDKDLLKEVLESSWRALRPGGVLVIHENIKNKLYEVDYSKMFTADEIDSLLEKFGKIFRFSAYSEEEYLDAESTGNATVFRVIQKNV